MEGNISEEAFFLSETGVESSISNDKTIYALFVLKKGEEETHLHPLRQPLIQEFEDIFLIDLPPSLPLLRGIEHQIDLLPGVSPLNKLVYRYNPTKTKEL